MTRNLKTSPNTKFPPLPEAIGTGKAVWAGLKIGSVVDIKLLRNFTSISLQTSFYSLCYMAISWWKRVYKMVHKFDTLGLKLVPLPFISAHRNGQGLNSNDRNPSILDRFWFRSKSNACPQHCKNVP